MSNSSSSSIADLEGKNGVSVEVAEIKAPIVTGKKAVDQALAFIEGKAIDYTEEDERRVLRKIDLRLMPLLFLLYCIQFADKVTLGYASLMGIRDDTHLNPNSQQYSWVSSIFYAGYIFFEFPTTYFLAKLPIAKYLVFNIFAWGTILTCTAAAKNYAGLLTLRFFLGMFESTITPAFVLITAMWYKRNEQARRMGIWLAANGVATLITSPIAYGLYYVHDVAIASWQILFLLFGLLTIITAVLFFFFFPRQPVGCQVFNGRRKTYRNRSCERQLPGCWFW